MGNSMSINKKLSMLESHRKFLGITQNDLGVLLGCGRSNYCLKEQGKSEISLTQMIKIQKAFNEKRELIEMQPLKLDEIFLS